ncbi:MAG: hypothetical protein M3326_04640 [Actinomycetota bacterium]|nr:hypothetical protein [Actinomycetota bacterium]
MSESSSPAPRRHNRANWVGLRTLRQLPKVVGETSAGEPIVEVRSVRLVLREGATHFSRMATCSKCGREVPGAPVLGPGDLDHPPHPVICKDCVRTASVPVLRPDRRSVQPAAESEPAGATDFEAEPDGDVAVLQRRIAQLEALVRRDRADWEKALEDRMGAARTERRALAAEELAPAREDVDELAALEARMDRKVERVTQRLEDQRAELGVDVERLAGSLAGAAGSGRLDDLEARLTEKLATLQAQLDARATSLVEDLVRGLDERVEASRAEARRIEAQVVDRLDRQAERSRRAGGGAGRLEALEEQLDEAMQRLAALVESQRVEFQEAFVDGLAEVRSAFAALDEGTTERLSALEEAAGDRAAELSELAELQATLDTGLGELRSEIEQLRETGRKGAHIDSRLDTLVDVSQLGAVEPGRGRRGGKKPADAVAALSAAVQNLLQDHRQVRAQLATLETQSETAVRASARASAQATAVHPLRQDVRAVREEVAAQHEAVAALAKTVETLRRELRSTPAAKRVTDQTEPSTKRSTSRTDAKPAKAAKPRRKA